MTHVLKVRSAEKIDIIGSYSLVLSMGISYGTKPFHLHRCCIDEELRLNNVFYAAQFYPCNSLASLKQHGIS